MEPNTDNQYVDQHENALEKLKIHQDFYYALIGGLLAAFLSALVWAVITVLTNYQIGYMAIAVGLAVGFAVQFFGAGIDKKFGILGAILAFFGCALGNFFSQVGFIANSENLGYVEVLSYMNISLITEIMTESFNAMDILFYGIATYEGYRFAFRRITEEEIGMINSPEFNGQPANAKLRLPLVIISIVILAFVIVRINMGFSGKKVYTYESGNTMSEGELSHSKKVGKWVYYYENGNIQTVAHYNNDIADSTWNWYDEAGNLIKVENYKNGLEHGLWASYYTNGQIYDSCCYVNSRMHGEWVQFYENGSIAQRGFYKHNKQDSIWEAYYENGNQASIGTMKDGKAFGIWKSYYANRQLSEETKHTEDNLEILNCWDEKGNQNIKDGNGTYCSRYENGKIMLTGEVKDGKKTGNWTTYYENGELKEVGKFDGNTYYIINSWDPENHQNVIDGNGIYIAFYQDNQSKSETGEILNGLRNGSWISYYVTNGAISMELNYAMGKLHGVQTYYYENGELQLTGTMSDNLRDGEWVWYHNNGNISSTVNYVKDKKQGKQIIYAESGEKTREEIYENGELIEETNL